MKRFAPAKINLSLKISGQRPDGYHEIETLIAPISLYDEVTVELSDEEGIVLECSDEGLACDASNLAWKAAESFFKSSGKRRGIRMHLEKRIPAGAGLGGGSSDAAAVILALDALCETKFSVEKMEEIAVQVGSDVPFFIRCEPAVCKGRGEIIEPIAVKAKLSLLLIKPPFEVSTAWAYQSWKNSRELPSIPYAPQKIGDVVLENDLERAVFGKHIFLASLKSWLLEQPGVRGALMSGSGAVVYGVLQEGFPTDELITKAKKQFGETLWISPAETLSSGTCR